MIKINLVVVGDIKENFYKQAVDEYCKRLGRFCQLKIFEVKENVNKNISSALKKDEESLLPLLKGYVVVLAISGKQHTSEELATKLEKLSLTNSEITFVIGASNGLSQGVQQKANELISFSKLTFPHQLMRVIFLEQLYRAFTIINKISYHK